MVPQLEVTKENICKLAPKMKTLAHQGHCQENEKMFHGVGKIYIDHISGAC